MRTLPEPLATLCRIRCAFAAASRSIRSSRAASATTGRRGLARVRSAVHLDGGARAAVHKLKYEGWWRVAEAMATCMGRLEPLTAGVSLIPVPLARRRERLRGYNQSERLAVALGARLGLPVRTDVLRRTRATRTQTALTPDARRANVAGAFAASRARKLRTVLVDDVFTTGATLLAAAEALVAAGSGAGGSGDIRQGAESATATG